MEGYLHKWTNYVSGWKERYFILNKNILCYFIVKGEEPRGKYLLNKNASVQEDKNDNLKIELTTDKGEILFLKANTPNEREAWYKSIKQAIMESSVENNEYNQEGNDYSRKDEKFSKKILKIKMYFDKLCLNNERLENILSKYNKHTNDYSDFHKEVNSIHDSNKICLSDMNESINELNTTYTKVYSDFNNMAKYFLENDSTQLASLRNNLNEEQHINLSIIYPNNINTLKSNNNSNLLINNTEVIQEESEIFYGTQEDETPSQTNIEIKNEENKNCLENFAKEFSKVQANPIYNDPIYYEKRSSLPVKKRPFPFNVWQILKDAVGKDLSKFCVPVYFNEPLSYLQRSCENFQYSDCLNKGGVHDNPYLRLAYVAGFCLGGFSMHENRTLKPFNPLLGETFEYMDNQLNFRYFAEQVSHHPPISACYAESDVFTFYTNSHAKSKLSIMRGALEFHPAGRTFINFKKFNETITYTKPRVCVRGLIIGKMRIDMYGKIILKNHSTEDFCELEIMEEGLFNNKDKGKVIGGCYDKDKNLRLKVEGNWRSHLDVLLPDSEGMFTIRENIWKQTPINTEPGKEEDVYFFTDFGINLNNLTEEMKSVLPHTDSRFRPDQRALEHQDYEIAANEKNRLEEKQRARRKEMEKNNQTHKPIYFEETYDELNGELIFRYVKDYWKDREKRNFSHLIDIF